MTVSGRCHGPGCQQEARVEYWCGEACQGAWARQFQRGDAVLPAAVENTPAQASPFLLGAIAERMPAVREAVQAEMDRVVADTLTQVGQQQVVHTEPGSMVEDIRRAYELVRDVEPPEPVQLTRSQFDALQAANPPLGGGYPVDGVLCGLLGVPVELVDTVEESTPYLEQRKQLQRAFSLAARQAARLPVRSAEFAQVASEDLQVAHSGMRGWLGRWIHRMRRTP